MFPCPIPCLPFPFRSRLFPRFSLPFYSIPLFFQISLRSCAKVDKKGVKFWCAVPFGGQFHDLLDRALDRLINLIARIEMQNNLVCEGIALAKKPADSLSVVRLSCRSCDSLSDRDEQRDFVAQRVNPAQPRRCNRVHESSSSIISDHIDQVDTGDDKGCNDPRQSNRIFRLHSAGLPGFVFDERLSNAILSRREKINGQD